MKSDGTGVYLANVKMSVNPFDETVVEQAFRLRERRVATEVIAASIGPDKAQEALHTASRDQGGAEPVAVAIFVAQQNLGVGQSVEHPHCGFMVTHLTVGEQHRDGATFAVSHGMEF